ncbi:MAG: hypothetical protein WC750_05485 [Patescibacteria group bacterium]|jgi:hypothetical protein
MLQDVIITARQVAIFPEEFGILNSKELAKRLISLESGYDGDPTFVPVADSSNQVGIMIALKSVDKKRTLQITDNKIDMFWSDDGKPVSVELEEIIRSMLSVIKAAEIKSIKRVGLITEILQVEKDHDQTVAKISDVFIPRTKCQDLINYQIRLSYKIELTSYGGRCNKVIDLLNGKSKVKPSRPVIVIRTDINTHQDEKVKLDLNGLEAFVREAYRLSDPAAIISEIWAKS